jgi:hypothetical protein
MWVVSGIENVYYIGHTEGIDFTKFNTNQFKLYIFEFNYHTYIYIESCTKNEK